MNIGYEKSKKWAEKNYAKIPSIMSPAFDSEMVRFNAIGFRHLMRKIAKRSRREQKFRFSLIPYAPKIVSDPQAKVTYRNTMTAKGVCIQFWGLEKRFGKRILRVVIRQKGNGSKHFYSIMEHTSKNPA